MQNYTQNQHEKPRRRWNKNEFFTEERTTFDEDEQIQENSEVGGAKFIVVVVVGVDVVTSCFYLTSCKCKFQQSTNANHQQKPIKSHIGAHNIIHNHLIGDGGGSLILALANIDIHNVNQS